MAEVHVRVSFSVRKGNLVYAPPQAQYAADMAGAFGPAPGSIQVTDGGTDVDLSQFTDPGWLHVYNQEPDGGASVSLGIYDPETDRYYPFIKLAPGQHTAFPLDELFRAEHVGTGTGTDLGVNRLRIRAKDAETATVFVGVFER